MSIIIKNNKMKKTIAAILLVSFAIACDSAQTVESNDSLTAPVIVDTIVPPVGIDTLVTIDGDTVFNAIQK
jgi:hypothetical protein